MNTKNNAWQENQKKKWHGRQLHLDDPIAHEWQRTHPKEHATYMRKWRAKKFGNEAEYYRLKNWKAYGIDPIEAQRLFHAVDNCQICGIGLTNAKAANQRSIDHDPDTKRIRGVLCGNCNRMIGLAYHNPRILEGAVKYLQVSSAIATTRINP